MEVRGEPDNSLPKELTAGVGVICTTFGLSWKSPAWGQRIENCCSNSALHFADGEKSSEGERANVFSRVTWPAAQLGASDPASLTVSL